MPEIDVQCFCGKIEGTTENINSSTGTRIVCCCDDCQIFAEYLGNEGNILDQYGGTDIFQMPISQLKISQGNEHIGCMRISSKGMYRWYASCCNTPIGNTLGSGVPFIGLIHSFMANPSTRDTDLGKIRGYLEIKFAKQQVPKTQQGSSFRIILRGLYKIILWKLRGLNSPSVFFNDNGESIVAPKILN